MVSRPSEFFHLWFLRIFESCSNLAIVVSTMLNTSLTSYPTKSCGKRSCHSSHQLGSTSAASPHSNRKVKWFPLRNLSNHPMLAEKFSIPRPFACSSALCRIIGHQIGIFFRRTVLYLSKTAFILYWHTFRVSSVCHPEIWNLRILSKSNTFP